MPPADGQAAPQGSGAPTSTNAPDGPPDGADAALVLSDGTVFWGTGLGAETSNVGEVCFNTSITGYQEILTDPSYAGQIITFTYPHIGNVRRQPDADFESRDARSARGLRGPRGPRDRAPSNWRVTAALWRSSSSAPRSDRASPGWTPGRLTRHIRGSGFINAMVVNGLRQKAIGIGPGSGTRPKRKPEPGTRRRRPRQATVTCEQTYRWEESTWALGRGYGALDKPRNHVVASVDFVRLRREESPLPAPPGDDRTRGRLCPRPPRRRGRILAREPPRCAALQRSRRSGGRGGRIRECPSIRQAGHERHAGLRHLPGPPVARRFHAGMPRTFKLHLRASRGANHPVKPPRHRAPSRSPARTTASWWSATRSPAAWSRPTRPCSTAPSKASASTAGPCSASSTTRKPPRAPRTAITSSTAS